MATQQVTALSLCLALRIDLYLATGAAARRVPAPWPLAPVLVPLRPAVRLLRQPQVSVPAASARALLALASRRVVGASAAAAAASAAVLAACEVHQTAAAAGMWNRWLLAQPSTAALTARLRRCRTAPSQMRWATGTAAAAMLRAMRAVALAAQVALARRPLAALTRWPTWCGTRATRASSMPMRRARARPSRRPLPRPPVRQPPILRSARRSAAAAAQGPLHRSLLSPAARRTATLQA